MKCGSQRRQRGADFEGERGVERCVRVESANGAVGHYEGERGAERMVRREFANGNVHYYEGE